MDNTFINGDYIMKKSLLAFTIAALFTTGVAYAETNYGDTNPSANMPFNDFDLNKDGVVSKQEIQQVNNDANKILQYMDSHNQQTMEQSEFSQFEVPQSQQQSQDLTLGGLIPG
jgi:hypothetical protein